MKNTFLFAMIIMIFLLTSCARNVSTPISNEDAVATAVATMLSGIPTNTSLPEPIATLTPEPQTLLPRSLYYLAQDANGKTQIYRLNRDGVTVAQITFEQDGVLDFDISPMDGTIAYRLENDLMVMDADGNNRQLLVSQPNITFSPSPIWSPRGRFIVYESGGNIVQYSIDTKDSQVLVLGTDADAKWPISFSPDGTKLIIRRHVTPSAPEARETLIYDFASQTLTPIARGEMKYYPCFGSITWNTSDTFFCHNHVFAGAVLPGLWRVNAMDGSVETLLESDILPYLPVAAPHEDANGNLYYLSAEVYDLNQTSPALSLVRSAADGITNRMALRPETFNVLKALWSPSDDALLILLREDQTPSPTSLILVPLDSSLPVVTIIADASTLFYYSLRWGP